MYHSNRVIWPKSILYNTEAFFTVIWLLITAVISFYNKFSKLRPHRVILLRYLKLRRCGLFWTMKRSTTMSYKNFGLQSKAMHFDLDQCIHRMKALYLIRCIHRSIWCIHRIWYKLYDLYIVVYDVSFIVYDVSIVVYHVRCIHCSLWCIHCSLWCIHCSLWCIHCSLIIVLSCIVATKRYDA